MRDRQTDQPTDGQSLSPSISYHYHPPVAGHMFANKAKYTTASVTHRWAGAVLRLR